MKKRVASLFLALALCVQGVEFTIPAQADDELLLQGQYTSGGYAYDLNDDGTATIVEYRCSSKEAGDGDILTIPAELDGHKVTALGDFSFAYKYPSSRFKTVIIPEGVETIGEAAFSTGGRHAATTLVLPSTLESIGRDAFFGFDNLKTLVIPENVTYIGSGAFTAAGSVMSLETVVCYAEDVEFQINAGWTAFSDTVDCTFYGYPGSTLETLVETELQTYLTSYTDPELGWTTAELPTNNIFKDIAEAPELDDIYDTAEDKNESVSTDSNASEGGASSSTEENVSKIEGNSSSSETGTSKDDAANSAVSTDSDAEKQTVSTESNANKSSGSSVSSKPTPAGSGSGSGSSSSSGNGNLSANAKSGKAGSWMQNERGWWFNYTDGTWPSNQWVELEWNGVTSWYFFDGEGYMVTGWKQDGSHWYYLHPSADGTRGYMYTGWHEIDGKWYCFHSNVGGPKGAMYVNTTTPDGYTVGADGAWVK